MADTGIDVESGKGPSAIPHWKMVTEPGIVTPEMRNWPYQGAGTEEDPYVVTWIDDDKRDPLALPNWQKWTYVLTMAMATLAVSFCSSAYSGGRCYLALR